MCHITGPDLTISEELNLHVMYDVQKVIVEVFEEWVINTDREADIHVRWRGYDDEEELTWEPLQQLVEDVPALVEGALPQDRVNKLAPR